MKHGVKLLWTVQGQIIANVEDFDTDTYVLENPAFVLPNHQGIQLIPILAASDQTEVRIRKSEILFGGALIEPVKEFRNSYSSQYGSGIQLLNG